MAIVGHYAAHMQVALEKGCPTSVKGFLKFCGASKETGSVVYFCFSDVLVSQLLLLGLNLVIFVLLMYIMCYPLQLSLCMCCCEGHCYIMLKVLNDSLLVVLCWFVSCIKYSF